jgi:hypothetical protein
MSKLKVSKCKSVVKQFGNAMLGVALVMGADFALATPGGIPALNLWDGATAGGVLETLRWLVTFALLIPAIALAGYAMLKVGTPIVVAYCDVISGKKTVNDVAGLVGLGAMVLLSVLILVIVLVVAAVKISPVNF